MPHFRRHFYLPIFRHRFSRHSDVLFSVFDSHTPLRFAFDTPFRYAPIAATLLPLRRRFIATPLSCRLMPLMHASALFSDTLFIFLCLLPMPLPCCRFAAAI